MMLQRLGKREIVSPEDFRRCMEDFIDSCKGFPQAPLEFKHTIHSGIYTRELFIKKGSMMIGAVHKDETVAILSTGTLKYFGPSGLRTLSGHKLLVSPPGEQRAVLALTDCVFTTIHRTDKLTVEEIADDLVEGGHEALSGGVSNKQTIENRRLRDEREKQLGQNPDIRRLL